MARYPEWFSRFDAITEAVRTADEFAWFGRNEMRAIFACSERDSIRLLHKFGAQERDDALSLPRSALAAQLEAIRGGNAYSRFLSQRHEVAKQLAAVRSAAAARQFHVERVPENQAPSLDRLPATITLRQPRSADPGVLEILFKDGPDLLRQIADFLAAASVNRSEFLACTEPAE